MLYKPFLYTLRCVAKGHPNNTDAASGGRPIVSEQIPSLAVDFEMSGPFVAHLHDTLPIGTKLTDLWLRIVTMLRVPGQDDRFS